MGRAAVLQPEFLPRAPSLCSYQPFPSHFPRAAEPLEGKRLRETARVRLQHPCIPPGRSQLCTPLRRGPSWSHPGGDAAEHPPTELWQQQSREWRRFAAFWKALTRVEMICLKCWVRYV